MYCLLIAFAFILGESLNISAEAAVWQWSVSVESLISPENAGHPRAFLWIPPRCEWVRAVVVGQHNMEEEPILEHPLFRDTLSRLNMAAIWISPGIDLVFRFDKGAGEHFDAMMTALARESGCSELEYVPIVPMGHSAAASYPWNFAAWNPQRTLAVISISGQWPFYQGPEQPDWQGRSIDGIPGLVVLGEYEWADERAAEGLRQRRQHPKLPLTMLAEPGAGHFDVSDEKVIFLSFYLEKAAQYRLPDSVPLEGPILLNPIDPSREGWLAERWRFNHKPAVPPAPIQQYTGNPEEAFWFFDGEIAAAAERFQARYRGQEPQLLGFVQDGKVVPQNKNTHQQVTLGFLPLEDGISFKLNGAFLDVVPEGRPERWTGRKAGSSIGHASTPEQLSIQRICGPVRKVSEDTFALHFYRMGMDNRKRSNEIWLAAVHPGDERYKRAVQQAVMHFPLRNMEGIEQHILFPPISDQPTSARSIPLQAVSDAGVPVYYYVVAGPAVVENDKLLITEIPPRSRFPIKVTVVAWQWGRSIEPKIKTAEPVERTFYLINQEQH
jgi:hypothetical protein